jgi:protein TonB
MAYKFFDTLLDPGTGARRTKRKLTLPVSIGIHLVVLAGVLIVPLLSYGDLPDPAINSAIRAFLVEAAPPPPPPPPPPPAAAAPRPVTAPKIEQPKPVVEEPKFTAPIETPKEIPIAQPVSGLDEGIGEPGGVEGGVSGGTQGGVVGGTVGGVVGGELGGQLGGVPGGIPAAPPPPPPPPPAPTGPVRIGGKIHAPSKLSNTAPVYPPMAKQARVEGTVILEATINAQGRVTDVKVLRGIPLLDNAAMDAVRQWRYSPTLLNGTPVPVVMTVTVNFRLGGSGSAPSVAKNAPAPAATPTPAAEAPAEAPAATEPPPQQ